MAKTRALLTDTERERLAGLTDVDEIKVYQARSRVRRRIEEELVFDLEILRENEPELFKQILEAVEREKEREEPDEPAPTPTPARTQSDADSTAEPAGDETVPELAEVESPATVDVDALEFTRDLTEVRREVLLEFVEWVASQDRSIKKGDFQERFWDDDRAERSGYSEKSFWEAFAKATMKQSDQFSQPNSRAYRWVGE